MKTAAAIGIGIRDFWEMTPAELGIYVSAHNDMEKQKQENALVLEYTNAALQRSKKMPALKEMLSQKPKQQTTEQMLAMVKHLNAMYGGNTEGVKQDGSS